MQLQDILAWREHPVMCIGALFAFSYTCLLAPAWQYPLLLLLSLLVVGLAAARDRSFDDVVVS